MSVKRATTVFPVIEGHFQKVLEALRVTLFAGAAIPGVLVEVTGTTSLRVEWQAPSFDILSRLIDYEVIIAREGRGQVIQEQVPTFFGRNNYPASDLLPGVVYVVTVRGLYTEDVIGVNSTLEATTQETGEGEGRGGEGRGGEGRGGEGRGGEGRGGGRGRGGEGRRGERGGGGRGEGGGERGGGGRERARGGT